jgi:hypothetical protein
MFKRLLRPDIAFIIILTTVLLAWMLMSGRHQKLPETTATGSSDLTVSQQGDQTTTNVDASSLQQATPPSHSATNASVSPQQAVPYSP